MFARRNVKTILPLLCVALAVALLFLVAACGGGGSKSTATPSSSDGGPTGTGGGGGGNGETANALVIIGSAADVNGILGEAVALDKLHMYLLTSLSQDAAAFDGVTFGGTDTVWGVQLLGPQENTVTAFNEAYAAAYGDPPADAPLSHAYDAVYTAALAAVAANASDGASIRDNIAYVANSPGDIATGGADGFAAAVEALNSEGGDVNYIGASGQVDFDTSGAVSKGVVQSWKVLNGEIAPIQMRDVDLAAEAGDEVPTGELKRAAEGPGEALVIGVIVTDDEIGGAIGNAAQLAIDEINAAGGVFGQDVQLSIETIADSSGAAGAVDALAGAGAGAIIGPVAADAVGPALEAAKTASVPLFALSGAPELALLDGGGFFYSIVPSIALQMPVLRNLAAEAETTDFCVLYVQGDVGEAMAAAFQRAAEFKESTVRSSEAFDPASEDHASLLESCIG